MDAFYVEYDPPNWSYSVWKREENGADTVVVDVYKNIPNAEKVAGHICSALNDAYGA